MLETPDHQITLLFEATLPKGQPPRSNAPPRNPILRFDFSWPAALVDTVTRACSGKVRMTLVYDPPLDPAFGAEFARVNLARKRLGCPPSNKACVFLQRKLRIMSA